MSTLTETILNTAQIHPEGATLSPKEFLHLASQAAVDQAFTRLAREGKLLRVGRGTYALAVASRFGSRPPSGAKVVEALSQKHGEIALPHGAAAANALGLSTQVPVTEVYITSGRSKTLTLGKRTVQIKHAPRWQLALGNRPAGMAVRALSWLGPEQAEHAIQQIHARLEGEEWDALVAARGTLPSWMAQTISKEMTSH